jgi:hypothetical protein
LLALDVAVLNVVGCVCVAGLWLWGSSGGFEPYCAQFAEHAFSKARLLRYVGFMVLYAAGVELFLRGAQVLVEKRWRWRAGVLGAALLYAGIHARLGAANAVYAFALGTATAFYFAKTRRLFSLVAWHVQWDLGALAVLLFTAVYTNGPSHQHIMFAYKAEQVERRMLRYAPDWGWVDRAHEVRAEYNRVAPLIARNRGKKIPVVLTSAYRPMFGPVRRFRLEYTAFPPADASERQVHLIACAILFDFAWRLEVAQDAEPFWTGASFSAFAADDLPSTFYTGFWKSLGRDWEDILPLDQTRRRWQREGLEQTAQQVFNASDFEPAALPLREPFRQFMRDVRDAGRFVRYRETEPLGDFAGDL